MEELNKRLVEVETVLKKLDKTYLNKIPLEIWDYIKQNKDYNYKFNYDEKELIENQKLNIDTIAILTYINLEYLLESKQKKEMLELLKKDEIYAENEKVMLYGTEDIFKIKNKCYLKGETSIPIQYKENIIKKICYKILKFLNIKK